MMIWSTQLFPPSLCIPSGQVYVIDQMQKLNTLYSLINSYLKQECQIIWLNKSPAI